VAQGVSGAPAQKARRAYCGGALGSTFPAWGYGKAGRRGGTGRRPAAGHGGRGLSVLARGRAGPPTLARPPPATEIGTFGGAGGLGGADGRKGGLGDFRVRGAEKSWGDGGRGGFSRLARIGESSFFDLQSLCTFLVAVFFVGVGRGKIGQFRLLWAGEAMGDHQRFRAAISGPGGGGAEQGDPGPVRLQISGPGQAEHGFDPKAPRGAAQDGGRGRPQQHNGVGPTGKRRRATVRAARHLVFRAGEKLGWARSARQGGPSGFGAGGRNGAHGGGAGPQKKKKKKTAPVFFKLSPAAHLGYPFRREFASFFPRLGWGGGDHVRGRSWAAFPAGLSLWEKRFVGWRGASYVFTRGPGQGPCFAMHFVLGLAPGGGNLTLLAKKTQAGAMSGPCAKVADGKAPRAQTGIRFPGGGTVGPRDLGPDRGFSR